MKTWITRLATALALLPLAAAAQGNGDWKFRVSLYGWLPSIDGNTTFELPPGSGDTSVEVSGKQILDSLNFVAMGSFDALHGRTGVFTDLIYVDAGADKTGFRELAIGGRPLPGNVSANVRLDVRSVVWTLTGYRRVLEGDTEFDLLAGVRLLDAEQTLGWQLAGNIAGLPLTGPTGSADAKLENWDAIIGLRGRVGLDDASKWFLIYHADIGTGDSDLTWQLMAGVGYGFGASKLVFAWRHLDYNAKSGKPIEELSFDGPSLMFAYRW